MKKFIRSLFISIIVFALCFGTVTSASAQETEDLEFVYGTNHFDGAFYSSTFVPSSVDPVYLLAEHISILASRMTDVYYWPITNEYRPDWDAANVVVEGSLEIFEGPRLVETVQMTEYVLQYDAMDRLGTTQLFLGEEAIEARQAFEDAQAQYRRDLYHYYEEMNIYREEFQQALADLQAGLITEEELPIAPEPLQDLTLFSTNLLYGFPVNLPPGDYRIQLKTSEGEILPESIKKLVIFEPLNSGIGYEILSEDRWTAPEASKDSNDIIYSSKNQVFFVEPYHQKLYNQRYYTRMNNPQDTFARADRTLWVSHRPVIDASLDLSLSSGLQRLELKGFKVDQMPGSRLGYQITPFDPDAHQAPSFTAFRIDLVSHPDLFAFELRDADDQLVHQSFRKVRVLRDVNHWWIYLIGSIPLLVGLVVVAWRRQRVRDIKVIGAG
jgi:hypothetical protein